jgi:hypothetical protein
MLESILITTVFNNIPFFDPIGIDPASHQKKNRQKTMNNCHTEQVQKLALEGSPRVKSTGFFEALQCFSYAKEQVSSEAMDIELTNDDCGEQPSVIQRAFAWTEDIDESADDLGFDSTDQPSVIQPAFAWTEDIDESADDLGFDSTDQPSVIQPAFAWTDIDESTADEVECSMSEDEVSLVSFEHQGKTLSGSVCTSTTVTMNTYNTIESWESLNTSSRSVSHGPAMDEEVAPERNSPPPLTIAVLSFKPKQRKLREDIPEFPSLPSVRSMRQMRTLSVASYAY